MVPREYRIFVDCLDPKGRKLANLKYNAGSKTVYLFRMVSRKEIRKSLRIKSESYRLDQQTFNLVQKKSNKLLEDLLRSDQVKKQRMIILDVIASIVERYEAKKEAGDYSAGSYKIMTNAFSRLNKYWGQKTTADITRDEWDQFQSWHEYYYPGQGQFNITKYMVVLINHCLEMGYLQRRPRIKDRFAKSKRILRKQKKSRIYTQQEILALDKACETTRELVATRLGHQLGFRISDVLNLTTARIYLYTRVPFISFTENDNKGSFEGKTPLTDDLIEPLKELISKAEAIRTPWIFYNEKDPTKPIKPYQLSFKTISQRAGIDWGTFHTLRHYRLTSDFMNPKFTSHQVCSLRRISIKAAVEHYIHTREEDMELLRNAGKLNFEPMTDLESCNNNTFAECSQNDKLDVYKLA